MFKITPPAPRAIRSPASFDSTTELRTSTSSKTWSFSSKPARAASPASRSAPALLTKCRPHSRLANNPPRTLEGFGEPEIGPNDGCRASQPADFSATPSAASIDRRAWRTRSAPPARTRVQSPVRSAGRTGHDGSSPERSPKVAAVSEPMRGLLLSTLPDAELLPRRTAHENSPVSVGTGKCRWLTQPCARRVPYFARFSDFAGGSSGT